MTSVAGRETWRDRARRLGVPLWRLAVETGASPATVAAYARGARKGRSAFYVEWLPRAHAYLDQIESEARQ